MKEIKKEEIVNIVLDSKSKSEVCKKLGLHNNGVNMNIITNLLKEYNINTDHFFRKDRSARIEKECPVCETKFIVVKGTKREKTTCSISCSNTYFRSGDKHGSYRDISSYTTRSRTYTLKYREICFNHHEHKCVVCDENKLLDVHHYDGDKFNNEPSNLVPLCATHHNYLHSKYREEIIDKVIKYVSNFIKK
jgi:hypothetical protein